MLRVLAMVALLFQATPTEEEAAARDAKMHELQAELKNVQARLSRAQHATTLQTNAAREQELQRELSQLQSEPDLASIEGTWKPVFARHATTEFPEHRLDKQKLVISNSRYRKWMTTRSPIFSTVQVSLDATKSPKQIDLTVIDGPRSGKTQEGIYELNGDQLVVCYGFASRPTMFAWKPDDLNLFLVIYERVKP